MIQVLPLYCHRFPKIQYHVWEWAFDSAAHTAHAVDIAQKYNQYGTVPARKDISKIPTRMQRNSLCSVFCSPETGIEYLRGRSSNYFVPPRLRECREGGREHKRKDEDYCDGVRACTNGSFDGEPVK